ncbi:MAG: hypothetical protein ACRD0K_30810 [Egibacteraceae bacterium]
MLPAARPERRLLAGAGALGVLLYTLLNRYSQPATFEALNRLGEVLPTSEARSRLTEITAHFRREGARAGIVVFGSRRRPEAAVVPYELIELLDPIVEAIVVAARARQRLADDDGTRYTIDDVAERLGIELSDTPG